LTTKLAIDKNSNNEVIAFANAGGKPGAYDNFNFDAEPKLSSRELAGNEKTGLDDSMPQRKDDHDK
jgi:hypothetical protein